LKLASNSKILVSIIDASFAGGCSRTVASKELSFEADCDISELEFELRLGTEFSESADLLITAHVDHDGDGVVSKGDLIAMQSYPIRSEKTFYQIEVKEV
jgi:hypothetical protein